MTNVAETLTEDLQFFFHISYITSSRPGLGDVEQLQQVKLTLLVGHRKTQLFTTAKKHSRLKSTAYGRWGWGWAHFWVSAKPILFIYFRPFIKAVPLGAEIRLFSGPNISPLRI